MATKWGSGANSYLAADYNPYTNTAYDPTDWSTNVQQYNAFVDPTTVDNANTAMSYTGGGMLSGGSQNYAGGAGTIAGAYGNATSNTGTSVISGAASGAQAGASLSGGSGYGALIGGVIGGLAGLFGSKSKKKEEDKEYKQQLELALAPYKEKEAQQLRLEQRTAEAMGNYSQFNDRGNIYTAGILGGGGNAPAGGMVAPRAPMQGGGMLAPDPGYGQAPVAPTSGGAQAAATYGQQYGDFVQQQEAARRASALSAYGQYGLLGG